MDFGDAFDALTASDTYIEQVGAGGLGYMAPYVVDNLADRFAPMDVPDPAAGLAVIAGAEMVDVPYKRAVQIGAGAYTFEAVAEGFDVKNTIINLGA